MGKKASKELNQRNFDSAMRVLAAPGRHVYDEYGGEAATVAHAFMAAHAAIHDDATEEDFMYVCQEAWKGSKRKHEKECK